MCKTFSFTVTHAPGDELAVYDCNEVTPEGVVIGDQSHSTIAERHGLRESYTCEPAKCEIHPVGVLCGPDVDISTWEFVLDEERAPRWWTPENADKAERLCRERLARLDMEHLTSVGWNLFLSGSQVTSLGALTSVGGNLDLRDTRITSLGALTSVGRNLFLERTQVTSLGALKSVGGSLDLSGTQVTSLGSLTSVGRSLFLSGTQVTSIKGVTVGGSVYGFQGVE